MMYTTRRLADYVHGLRARDLSPSTRDAASRCLHDAITAAVAGAGLEKTQRLHDVACATFRPGGASIWFDGRGLDAIGAAYCNSASASALDLDDGSRAARGHPGAAVIPVALAVAEEQGSSLDDVLVAITAGYEVGVGVAAHRNPAHTHSWQSGRWVGLAAAAAAGSLRRTPPRQLSQAFAMAGVTAPNQEANGSSGYARLTGNDVKEGIPWAVVGALTALRLAEAGHIGPEDLLDHASHFDAPAIARDLGGAPWVEQTYFKPYSCCRYIHAAIDAFDALREAHGIVPDAIEQITVHTFGWALRLGNAVQPSNLVDVQYSVPYCLGLAAVAGTDSMVPVTPQALHRADASAVARKVRLVVDPDCDARFPAETLARVSVRTVHGVFESPTTTPRGEPSRPMRWDELDAKRRVVCEGRLAPERQRALRDAMADGHAGRLAPLLAALRGGPPGTRV